MIDLRHGDMRDVLPTIEAESVHSCVTDPPYHLGPSQGRSSRAPEGMYATMRTGFMGKQWDGGSIAFDADTWRAVHRVLKPGGYLLAFASTRGYHRMVCAIEDAGFLIHPMIAWVFATGFPKATKFQCPGVEGWRYGMQSLKPAIEPICMAQRPMIGTGTENWLRHGTGGINVDACRVGTSKRVPGSLSTTPNNVYGAGLGGHAQDGSESGHDPNIGRWPANLVHDSSPEVEAAFAAFANGDENPARFFANCGNDPLLYSDANAIFCECKQRLVNIAKDGSSPPIASSVSVLTHAVHLASRGGATLRNCLGLGATVTVENMTLICWHVITAILNTERSASPEQRPEPLSLLDSRVRVAVQWPQTDTMTITISHWKSDGSADPVTCSIMRAQTQTGEWTGGKSRFHYSSKADSADRADSSHPTVKPVELLRWMVRLVTPKGGTILDPFAGSGTTGEAAMLEGFNAILIEREAEHAADIAHRQRRWHGGDLPLFAEAAD